MSASLAEQIAGLPEEQREQMLDGIDPTALAHDWSFWGRPEQFEPDGEWGTWLILSGRGWGKTRTIAEWVRKKARDHPGCRILLVGRTSADVRDVLVSGDSGILSVCPDDEKPEYVPSKRLLQFPNGSIATTYSAEVPDQLRGPQAHYAAVDELAAWNQVPGVDGATAWDQVQLATRLGDNPQIVIATTPKRVPMMRELVARAEIDPQFVITRGSTYENTSLSSVYLSRVTGLHEGTALGRQELFGEMLDASEGALWSDDLLALAQRVQAVPELGFRVVGVDPSVAENPRDECGIVVAGATTEKDLFRRRAFVLEDASVHGSPDTWARAAIAAARKWRAPIIAEGNQGGALLRNQLRTVDPTIPVFIVNASQGKATRAEPVVAAYEQQRVSHVGFMPMLESQMTTWLPEETKKSPDRLDALVWALTALLVRPPDGLYPVNGGVIRAKSPAARRINRPASASATFSRVRRATRPS